MKGEILSVPDSIGYSVLRYFFICKAGVTGFKKMLWNSRLCNGIKKSWRLFLWRKLGGHRSNFSPRPEVWRWADGQADIKVWWSGQRLPDWSRPATQEMGGAGLTLSKATAVGSFVFRNFCSFYGSKNSCLWSIFLLGWILSSEAIQLDLVPLSYDRPSNTWRQLALSPPSQNHHWKKNVYLCILTEREREREHEREGEGQRVRETEFRAVSMLSKEADVGLNPTTVRS